MVATISYFIIFGIVSIASGKLLRNNREDSYKEANELELQQFLISLANQGSNDGPSNYREDVPNTYQENRAGASRYNEKPRKVYYQKEKGNPQPYYRSYGNAGEDKPNYNSLQIINQFLTQNGDKPGYNNAQNLLEELLSLERNNKFQPLKPSDESDNVDEVLALLGNLQKNPSDVETYKFFGKGKGNNLKAKKLIVGANNDQPDAVLVQGKDGVMKYVGKIVGNKPQHYNADYLNNLDDEMFVVRDDKDDDSYNARDDVRCKGKNCARTNRAVYKNNRLHCKGKNCARSKTAENDSDVKYDLKPNAEKIKVNDELDAVVLGISDVDHLLSKLNAPKSKERTNINKLRANKNVLLQNVDLQNLLNSKNNIGENPNVEAVVFDLTQVENGAAVARQIKQLLSQDNERSYDEYDDYGNLVEDYLKQGIYDLQQDVGADGANTQIIAHNENNNNVYVPQWLLNEVVRSYGGRPKHAAVKEQSKLSLPITRRQNANRVRIPKLFRRNIGQDVGVPFHLEVEGLGQVNP